LAEIERWGQGVGRAGRWDRWGMENQRNR